MKKCLWCGKNFKDDSNNKQGLYCSDDCRRDVSNRRKRGPIVIRNCKNCGKEIKTTNSRKIFCSKKCNIEFISKGQRYFPVKGIVKCEACGSNFETTKAGYVKYCSDKCKKTGKSEKGRRNYFKLKFGISVEDLDALRIKQGFKCGICGKHEFDLGYVLCVDHNHDTGEIRGLLCHGCNTALGKLGDSEESILKALAYLRKSKLKIIEGGKGQ